MKKVKELKARRSPFAQTLFELYYEDGGELPKDLRGKYTSEQEALTAADNYLAIREQVRPRNKKESA